MKKKNLRHPMLGHVNAQVAAEATGMLHRYLRPNY